MYTLESYRMELLQSRAKALAVATEVLQSVDVGIALSDHQLAVVDLAFAEVKRLDGLLWRIDHRAMLAAIAESEAELKRMESARVVFETYRGQPLARAKRTSYINRPKQTEDPHPSGRVDCSLAPTDHPHPWSWEWKELFNVVPFSEMEDIPATKFFGRKH